MTETSGEPPTSPGRRSAPRSGAAADQTRIVRRYLSSIEGNRAGRAGKRAQEAVTSRIAKVDELLVSADPLARVHLTQERIELHTEQVRLGNGSPVDPAQLERDFVRVARSYSDRHGLTYAAWRQVGVATEVLDRSGIFRADRKPPAKAKAAEPSASGDVGRSASVGSDVSANGRSAAAAPAEAPPALESDVAEAPAPPPSRAAMPLELADDLGHGAGRQTPTGSSARPATGT